LEQEWNRKGDPVAEGKGERPEEIQRKHKTPRGSIAFGEVCRTGGEELSEVLGLRGTAVKVSLGGGGGWSRVDPP